ncbi:MsnO8 family LLM class oxidoreductase [Kineococcus terrestris]|uniref:MsnO8 family LLM class oxidoreductase n=1 Tax=Kineococcus terrestris TaxID=2044856 RepID=UPI0034DAF989
MPPATPSSTPSSTPPVPRPGLVLLDRSRTRTGADDAAAVRATVRRARAAEALGYDGFWVAEHHGVPGVVGPAPAVLLAAVGAATSRIRLGSGGVMLPQHPPLVVAEQFAVLAALHPGRVELGVGRSVGFTAPVRRALRTPPEAADRFADDLRELLDLLRGRSPVTVRPAVPRPPEVVVLASRSGLASAAALGLPVVVPAGADPAATAAALDGYRAAFAGPGAPRAGLLLDVLVADSAQRARRELLPQAWSLAVSRTRGEFPPLPAPGEVDEAALSGRERRAVEEALAATVHGTEEEVGPRLADLLERTGAQELVVAATVHDPELQEESDARLADLLLAGGR